MTFTRNSNVIIRHIYLSNNAKVY